MSTYCGPRYGRADGGARTWLGGRATARSASTADKVEIERPRVRARDGGEFVLPSGEYCHVRGLPGRSALNLMLVDVLNFGVSAQDDPACREDDVAAPEGPSNQGRRCRGGSSRYRPGSA